jgi:hypothetical protein
LPSTERSVVWPIWEEEVLDLGDRLVRVDDPEVGHRGDAHRDVVLRDHLLRRNGQRDRPQVDADHAVHDRDQEDEPGPLLGDQPAEAEDDAALVLAQDPDSGGERDRHEDDQQDDNRDDDSH